MYHVSRYSVSNNTRCSPCLWREELQWIAWMSPPIIGVILLDCCAVLGCTSYSRSFNFHRFRATKSCGQEVLPAETLGLFLNAGGITLVVCYTRWLSVYLGAWFCSSHTNIPSLSSLFCALSESAAIGEKLKDWMCQADDASRDKIPVHLL